MFPIRDARGRVIGFGGRVIDQGEPKYLNSPETQLFHKGRELYGLYEVRQSRVDLKRLLVVEGYMDVVRLHQAGLQYAVATLGTATTPEHLKRAFRLVSEIVFCFDGDRAGRAAAWRALGNALPEARDGRTLRFLFLPDGQDPDSLVGAEGREAFEVRIKSALPLSEYLVSELSSQHDLAHADGRGGFAAAALPLVKEVPEGVFRDLLVERVAEAIKLPAERLRTQWQRMADSSDANVARRARPRAATDSAAGSQGDSSSHGAARSAGRGGMVTQAVRLLVHFPAIATAVPSPTLELLRALDASDVRALLELLDSLRADPASLTAQLLQRHDGKPLHRRLVELASESSLVTDPKAAAREFLAALDKIRAEHLQQRFDELARKDREAGLSDEEKQEFQALMRREPVEKKIPKR
jgi:DNA primase